MAPPALHPDDRDLDRDFGARWGRRRAAVGGWCADLGRFAGTVIPLNLRKSLFRLRRGRGICPCQTPSDSGKAGETACEPVASWHEPRRFQRICPLLRQRPDGAWKCSVNAAEVRPFWGRAAAWVGGSTAAAYLVATLLT